MNKNFLLFIIILALSLLLSQAAISGGILPKKNTPDYYKPYLDFLAKVYDTMDKNYYKPVSKEAYDEYIDKYKETVLSKLTEKDKKIDNIAYIGAGLLVNRLKNPQDKFTTFIPPKEAAEYEKKVYGYELGIGIKGNLTKDGYLISKVEIRSDAYAKDIRPEDLIIKINSIDVKTLDEKKIKDLLYPPLKTVVKLDIIKHGEKKSKLVEVVCAEYFNETVSNIPTNTKDIYCLKISSFNKKTSDDLKEYIAKFEKNGIKLLILDVRDNPGGPPLAVHELSGIFLPPNTRLFYYKKKDAPEAGLVAPKSDVHYGGPIVILVDKKSGSASEILAGTFKAYKRAIIIGKEPTAGMAFLKSTFKFDDGSMIAMITGNSYLFNGTELDLNGIQPNSIPPKEVEDLVSYVVDNFEKNEVFKNSHNKPKP